MQCARRTGSRQDAQTACVDFGIALASAQSNALVFTRALALVWQSGHGRSTGLTTSSGEHYRVHGMERRNSLQTRSPGLASTSTAYEETRSSGLAPASTAYEETTAFPAMVKQRDKCDNIAGASAKSLRYVTVSILKDIAMIARRGGHTIRVGRAECL